jgi:hypothetical protein
MRKPGAGSLPAAIAVASLGATQIAFDTAGGAYLAVRPGDQAEDIALVWPW